MLIDVGKSELNGYNVLWLRVAGSLNVVAKRPISFFIFTLFGQLFPHSSSEIIGVSKKLKLQWKDLPNVQ